MYYQDVFAELNKNKIRYLVIGGIAVNLYGYTRMTIDLDLIISLDQKNKTQFYETLKKLNYRTKKPDLAKKLMTTEYKSDKIKVVTFFKSEFEVIDVFIDNPIDFEKAYSNKKIFKADKLLIPTIPFNMLLEMKEKTGRELDLRDLGYLKKINNEKKK